METEKKTENANEIDEIDDLEIDMDIYALLCKEFTQVQAQLLAHLFLRLKQNRLRVD